MEVTLRTCQSVPFYACGGFDPSVCAHGFSTRLGGVSPAPWDSLNLGANRGDAPERVAENFRRFCGAVGTDADALVKNHQVHGDLVRPVTWADVLPSPGAPGIVEADGLVTRTPGLCLTVFSADCIPVLLCDPRKKVAAAVHAGWRGCAAGIVEKTVREMVRLLGARPERILAAVGPCIGKCCFETDGDVADAFHELMDPAVDERIERRGDKYHIDLKSINRLWLLRSGLDPSRIDVHPDCTKCRPDRYWSHRGMGGERGGMAAVIVLTEDTL